MSLDISSLVVDWSFDSNETRARWIHALDGTRKIQLRLDLGVLQMEPDGRPDGLQPHGAKSLCQHYTELEANSPNQELPFKLDGAVCAALQQEAMQFYYRVTACSALGDFTRVVRDCEHNLDIIDIVSDYALDDEVAWQFTQLYPYMRMMLTRAQVEILLAKSDFAAAETFAAESLEDLEAFFAERFEPTNEDGSTVPPPSEVEALRELLEHVRLKRPRSQAETLSEELARAVELENYEKAAALRDQLNAMKGFNPHFGAKKRAHSGGRENPT